MYNFLRLSCSTGWWSIWYVKWDDVHFFSPNASVICLRISMEISPLSRNAVIDPITHWYSIVGSVNLAETTRYHSMKWSRNIRNTRMECRDIPELSRNFLKYCYVTTWIGRNRGLILNIDIKNCLNFTLPTHISQTINYCFEQNVVLDLQYLYNLS